MQSSSVDAASDGKIQRVVEEAIAEDLGLGDVTTEAAVPPELRGVGVVLAKEDGILAGIDIFALVFTTIDPEIHVRRFRGDGEKIAAQTVIANVEGSLAGILKGERTALNFLQRMSGIATLTRRFVDAVNGTAAKITDTRKTVPGLRIFDKLAVRIGGGVNHRFGLDDMVLVKDNHIAAAGGLTQAVKRCRSLLAGNARSLKIEVETKSIAQVKEALALEGIDRIMLDNFTLPLMKEAVSIIHHRVEVEASGNVSLRNVRGIAETGVDFVSIGALTHSVKALDISLDLAQSSNHSRSAS